MLATLAQDQIARKGEDSVKFFEYGEVETDYLKEKDEALAKIIDQVGHIYECVDPDIYTSLVRIIIGQQISIAIYEKTWAAFQEKFGDPISPESVREQGIEGITALGIPTKRAEYILGITDMVIEGTLDVARLKTLSDDDAMSYLCSIKGVGPWTAEMVLLFYLQRKNVFSYGDIALLRGLRMMYNIENLTKERFEEFRKLFTPYCTIASLYIWEVGEGHIKGFTDPRPKKKSSKK